MGVRVKQENIGPEFVEVPWEERVTEVDGVAFHWSKNEKRTFSDDTTGIRHASFRAADTVVEDADLGDSRS